jgi:hypothetical protein
MPRSKPLPQTELQIAKRLIEARMAHGLLRSAFTTWFSPAPDALKRIELGRVPLSYEMARKLWDDRAMPHLNPMFLAQGYGAIRLEHELWLPRAEEIGVAPGELFSSVIALFVEELRTLCAEAGSERLPASWIPAQHFMLQFKRHKVRTESARLDAFESWLSSVERRSIQAEKKHLRLQSLKSKSLGMAEPCEIPTLSELIARATTVTRGHGLKSALAKQLKVPPSRVTEWLKRRKEPGGAITLELLDKVLAMEAEQQTKSAGSVITAASAKTRKRTSHENKPKSSQP